MLSSDGLQLRGVSLGSQGHLSSVTCRRLTVDTRLHVDSLPRRGRSASSVGFGSVALSREHAEHPAPGP